MEVKRLGETTKEELETRIQKVAAAGKLSRFPGNVFEVLESCNDYESNLKLIKRIIKMGHKSIIEHDYLVFALCDVSPIIEQTIIASRLTSFTIKSRREVDFRNVGYYTPTFRDTKGKLHSQNEILQDKYQKHMKYLFSTYADMVDKGMNVEDARFVLPYSYHSNIIMGLDARELEKLILSLLYGSVSKIAEAKELGNRLVELVKKDIPYLVESIEQAKMEDEDSFSYLESLVKRPKIEIEEKVRMLSYTPHADDVVMKSNIMYHYQCKEQKAEELLEKMQEKDPQYREKMMKSILKKEERRELEQVSFTFQIPISLSILTHLTRHRMHSLLIPEFTPMWDLDNYIIPKSVKQIAQKEYVEAFKKNKQMYETFKELGVFEEDLVYFYLGGQMCNVLTTMNARTLAWVTRLRCCNKAQWQIREIAKEMKKQVEEVAPLIGKGLGATCVTENACYEGKESCGLIDKILEVNTKK